MICSAATPSIAGRAGRVDRVFYPFFSTTNGSGTCAWQEGGEFIPGTTNDFGRSSTAEYGPLLQTVYPVAGFKTRLLFNNFNSGDMPNACPVR